LLSLGCWGNLQPELTLRLHKNGETRLAVYGVTAAPRPICAENILGDEIKITHSQPILSVLRHLHSDEERKQIDFLLVTSFLGVIYA
jgi:hypothetical protein